MGQKLGQHFLKNANVAEQIASFVVKKSGERVIEIGPGHGELTRHLLAAGAYVTAVEKDRAMVEELKKTFAKNIKKGLLTIIEGDVLEQLRGVVEEISEQKKPYIIAGNIPYYLTGYLLRIIGEILPRPERVVFLIQKEVAQRMCARKGTMNILASSVQFWARPKIVMRVRRGSFVPPPRVESAVVELVCDKKQAPVSADNYFALVHSIFSHPRKTLLNNLRDDGYRAEEARSLIHKAGLDDKVRPHQLGIDEIIHLAVLLAKDNAV